VVKHRILLLQEDSRTVDARLDRNFRLEDEEETPKWRALIRGEGQRRRYQRLGINGSPPGEFVSEEQETKPPATAVNG
jgi:hypothetical protein